MIDTHKTIPLSTLIYQVLGIPIALYIFFIIKLLGCPIASNNKTLLCLAGPMESLLCSGKISPHPTPDFGRPVNPIAMRVGELMPATLLFVLENFLTILRLCKVVYLRSLRNFLPLFASKWFLWPQKI